ncbi:hypothetical protein SmJEL517_g03334 [Synchytrium microbalum]|uniref:UDP-galactose transporter homolog 1 n=1 Tax=Synchytrium microbalum TaxID=1806994 RepID=A0A507C8Q6_9FUNG|nr:uncharacterized protein SmJEL517_g03334 [Synchytrium microbalum]TPX33885.1 hypothetical protein SmJEL517_g03334 [Synchytrium microbalum]
MTEWLPRKAEQSHLRLELLRAADYHDLQTLYAAIVEEISIRDFSNETILELLSLGYKYTRDNSSLKAAAIKYIVHLRNRVSVTKSEAFTNRIMYGELAICVLGIYICFIKWGEMQERITTLPYNNGTIKFKHYLFLNLAQSIIASLASSAYVLITKQGIGKISRPLIYEYIQVCVMQAIAPQFGYAALKHIDYPTVILGKSCKLVPVMVAGIVLHRKSFAWYKYVVVALITAGVSGFMLLHDQENTSKGSQSSSAYGLLLLTCNLLIDGATNSTQESMFKRYHIKGPQMMFFMNIGLASIMATYLLINPYTSEISNAVIMMKQDPSLMTDILLFGLCGASGQLFIFHTLQRFGAVSLVTVTVTRKMLTILWSVFRFGHYLNAGQWVSVGLVFIGILVDGYAPKEYVKKERLELGQMDSASSTDAIHAMNGDITAATNGLVSNGSVNQQTNGRVKSSIDAVTEMKPKRRTSERIRRSRQV